MRRSDYSGKAITLRQEVERLVEEGDFQGGFLVDKPPEAIVRLNAPDLEGFPTRQRPLQETLELLRSDKLKGIGIFGTVGVGKTAIMKNLNNHEEVAKMFDIVIWVNVSREMNEEKLQLKIAQRLKLKMESATCSGDLARIISEHMKDKKYLLLLDEVMDSIDLQQIGIPDNGNGSKVVLTTEFRHVCSSMTERMVKVDRLSPDEAWRMFQQTAAEKIDLPDVEPVARLVAEECDRLPLVIRTVASSFKLKESDSEWRNGLRELEKWPEIEIQGLTNMHAFLKFCYHELKDEKKKKCFLYGALYPAGSKIYVDHLVECWAAEGFLGTIDDRRRFRDARDEGYDILGHLVNVSLLEKGERMIYVQVNNSVRQVALYISSQEPDCKFIALKGEHSPYPQNATDWQQAKRISMIEGKLLELPESPNCEELLTRIASLPLSVSTLTRLKALFLNDCPSITKLPTQVAELRFLEVLDIRGCKIIFIPPLIGKLVYLRCLRMSYHKCSNTEDCRDVEIVDNVISRLLRLEELMIDVTSYGHWCVDVARVIQEVASLENLTTLRICFPQPEILKMLMENKRSYRDHKQLTSFWFFVGCENKNNPPILDYFDHNNIKCLSDFMNVASLNHVRGCLIERCNEMTTILDGNKVGVIDILPILEQLHLRSLLCLKSVFEGPIAGKSLSKLHTIVVKICPMLRKILSNGVIQQLSKLKKLAIESCFEVEELIENYWGVEPFSYELPSLEILELIDLPKLRTICAGQPLAWPYLKVLKIFGCHELKSLPFNEDISTKLKLIEGEQIWWEALQWRNSEPKYGNGSKVVLTTEFRHVCSSMTDRMVKMDKLSSDEAWRMFQQIAAEKIDLPDVEPVARLVVDECDRLPLVIRTVASSFKLKDSDSEWRNGLSELEKWPKIEIPGLTKILLLECWAAEGLLGNIDDRRSLRDARDKGFDILGHLTNVPLLEKGERMIYVQVNNSVRQLALYVSSQDPDCKFFAPKGETSPYTQRLKDWQQAKRISMIEGKLNDLPAIMEGSRTINLILVLVGCESDNNPWILHCLEYNVNRYMRYCCPGNDDSTVRDVLPKTDALELIGHNNIKCLTDFMNVASLNHVRGCLIERCNKITSIWVILIEMIEEQLGPWRITHTLREANQEADILAKNAANFGSGTL
ncbi:NB-ARC domain-containing disease resistance protein [Theobroma cacao]|uniref:NB-ARC domain-containing disease resistance protein n=1 Tax=Theobroma cacao TaxID=3641 RepID=A0A061DX48_THECC|nr:NB-ARC domain-containing disease resistance protein [Theobroma cacao]